MTAVIPFLVFGIMVYITYKRSVMLLFSLSLIFIIWLWKFVSVVYIDLNPNTYSPELERYIGGGASSLILISIYFMVTLGFLLVFRAKSFSSLLDLSKNRQTNSLRIGHIGWYSLILFSSISLILISYIEILKGPVPFFAAMERNIFMVSYYKGFAYKILLKYINYISLILGVIFLYELRQTKKALYSLYVFFSMSILLVLAGHKFSSLVINFYLFTIPLTFILLDRRYRLKLAAVVIFFVVLVSIANFNNFLNTKFTSWKRRLIETTDQNPRKIQNPQKAQNLQPENSHTRKYLQNRLKQFLKYRILIAQGQSWWTATDRIFTKNDWKPKEAFEYIFLNPIGKKNGNTAAQYLMYRDVGSDALRILKMGAIYSVGFPENLLELSGKFLIYPVVLVLSVISAGLLYLFFREILKGHYLSVITVAFVMKPFITVYLGGPINLLTWRYAVKIILMIAALWYTHKKDLGLQTGK